MVSVKTAEAFSLRKHAHEVYRDFVRSKHLKISLKHFDIFNIVTQNIHCGYTLEPPRSNEYPKYMFWNKNKKNRHTLFCYIKVGFKGVYMPRTCNPDAYNVTEIW